MNYVKAALLLTALTVSFVWIGKMIGGQTGMVIALTLAVAMNGVSYWFSDKIVLKMYRARPVDAHEAPELHGMSVRQHTCSSSIRCTEE